VIGNRVRDNFFLALGALRVSKMRSALTILGVVIGVSTVMAMATIVQGIREQILHTLEIAGPSTFYVMKVFSQTPLNPDDLPKHVRIRPDLRIEEARRVAQLPEVKYASIWAQMQGRIEFQGTRTQLMVIMAADDRFTEIQGGELADGRWFTRAEMSSGSAVTVLEENAARKVFGNVSPLDKFVRIDGKPARVIGIYMPPGNIFQPPGQQVGAIIPYLMAEHQFNMDKTNGLFIPVKPRGSVSLSDAQAAVTLALRESRRLRPGEPNTFDLISQDQILSLFNKITIVFFAVMIALSSVGLMVGGIGVMAIMMVSVTDRTREIGIRKAVGATYHEILFQFLVEAATLTGIGGAIGIAAGLGVGRVATKLMKIDASTPIAITITAVVVSVGIGVVFGILPARRAARMDPIEALRYE
jgi:putative ABC transport system permease protein